MRVRCCPFGHNPYFGEFSEVTFSLCKTKVLRCVDWGDAREARSAGDLIARWAPIGLADALELLSPAFSNPEVLLPPSLLLHISKKQ